MNKNSLQKAVAFRNDCNDLPLFSAAHGHEDSDFDGDKLSSDHLGDLDSRVISILRDRPRELALRGVELCRLLGMSPTDNCQRRLRSHVRRLVLMGFPLGTSRSGSARGFYWLVSPTDRHAAATHLRRQAVRLWERAARLESGSAAAEHHGQMRLPTK